MDKRIVIAAAHRTPQGRFLGALAKYSAADLAVHAGRAALDAASALRVDAVVLGNVLAAGQGMNIARQVGVRLNLPLEVPAYTANMMCASGMQAVLLAAQAIRAGEATVVLCGGTESMSGAPYLLDRARSGYRLGDGRLTDAILRDGLVDTFSNDHMGLATDRMAREMGIARAEQDAFAAESHRRYFAAQEAGRFAAERVPMKELDHDEHARRDATLEKLAALKPAFDPQGTVTPGNASGINDGAAMLVVAEDAAARAAGLRPLAVIEAWAAVGCEPARMGLGPVHAIRALCERTGASPADFDVIEINEAFAAQVLACLRELKLEGDARVNPDGGAIAVGHPIGTSGARLLVHLAHRIREGRSRRALAALCVGGGMGVAAALAAV